MPSPQELVYCPALRFKAGELAGTSLLGGDVANCVLPRWIIPPPKERDEEDALLFAVERLPDISQQLLGGWGSRPCLIDVGWIIDEFGRPDIGNWLPAMFARARSVGCTPIPMAKLEDLNPTEIAAFKSSISYRDELKFAVLVDAGDMEEPATQSRLDQVFDTLELDRSECAFIADASKLDFSNAGVAALVLEGILERAQELGLFKYSIVQGTNYPDVNPAPDGGSTRVLRNEWLAWKQAVRFNPETGRHLIFGDFCADCAKLVFGPSGAPAIRHVRYALENYWIVERGRKVGKSNEEMRSVFRRLLASGEFAGERVSEADAYISRVASNSLLGCGNATTWRQLNTTRHITQTVLDIARVRGIEIKQLPAPELARQESLFDSN